MFSNSFPAIVQHLRLKRKSQDEGGDLVVDITLGSVLTQEMAQDLGDEIVTFLATEASFKNITMDNVADGLISEFWHEDQDPTHDDPYISLSGLSTKKYKLIKEPDTHSTLFNITLKTSLVNEAQMLRLTHCLGCYVYAKIDFAQQSLNLDSSIEEARRENDADDEEFSE